MSNHRTHYTAVTSLQPVVSDKRPVNRNGAHVTSDGGMLRFQRRFIKNHAVIVTSASQQTTKNAIQ
jgi:hypothetical protein